MPNWPSKPETRENYDDFDNGFESGQRVMHDAFMKVIKSHNVCSQHHPDHWDANCPMCNTTIESQPKIHSCKCRTGDGGAMTVKMLDEGLCQCPRCGGIIIPKPTGLIPFNILKCQESALEAMKDRGIKITDEISRQVQITVNAIYENFGKPKPQRDIPSVGAIEHLTCKYFHAPKVHESFQVDNCMLCGLSMKDSKWLEQRIKLSKAIHDLISGGKNEGK